MIQISILNLKHLSKVNMDIFHVSSLEQSSDLVVTNIIIEKIID